jgi:hypothetical protein
MSASTRLAHVEAPYPFAGEEGVRGRRVRNESLSPFVTITPSPPSPLQGEGESYARGDTRGAAI